MSIPLSSPLGSPLSSPLRGFALFTQLTVRGRRPGRAADVRAGAAAARAAPVPGDPAPRDPATRDLATGDPATRDLATGDPATGDPVPRDPIARDPGPLRSFDPVEVGHLESAVWAAYYRRQWLRLLLLTASLVHRAFRMDWPRTVHGSWLVLRANQLWAPYPHNDPEGARRCMRRFYALLRLAYGGPADPARAAALEVGWWAAHRSAQRQPGSGGEPAVVTALARLYAYLYGVGEPAVRPAAEERAAAMALSDQWVDQGCPPGSALLAAERAALVRSYAALLAAVHR